MADQQRYNRRSRHVTEGVARSPNRSMYYAMGYEKDDFDKPMVGIANGHSTITPCNSGLQKLADIAITAVKEAGANPQSISSAACRNVAASFGSILLMPLPPVASIPPDPP